MKESQNITISLMSQSVMNIHCIVWFIFSKLFRVNIFHVIIDKTSSKQPGPNDITLTWIEKSLSV